MNIASSSRSHLVQRLAWIIVALAVLACCEYLRSSALMSGLPPLVRTGTLAMGWTLALILIIKALMIKIAPQAVTEVEPTFPSPALVKIQNAQDGLQMGFVALDSHARIVLSNSLLETMLDTREATSGAGLARAFHPDAVSQFTNTFQDICQSASGTATLKLRSFDKMQHLHHLQVSLVRWKEPPVAAIAILHNLSEQENCRHELQIANDALHDLHGVFAGESHGPLDTMRALLDLGKLHFRVEMGVVAKLADQISPRLEVVQIVAASEQLKRGDVFDPTLPSHPNFPRVLAHAGFVKMAESGAVPPIYKSTREGTFVGAPLFVKEQLYGVLCFASPASRPEGFYAVELELVQFMANWLGREIERRQLIEEFEARQHHLTELNTTLETLLRNDLLTGLSNRAALEDRLTEEFARARHFSSPLSVIALTPQDSKMIRSQYGESTWEQIQERLGKILDQHIRNFDIAARYNDTTFVIVLPRTDFDTARTQLEKLQTEVAQTPFPRLDIQLLGGVAALDDNCQNSEQLLQNALDNRLVRQSVSATL